MTKRQLDLPTLVAFATIYVVWGSTYLAIRILVESIPPLLGAGSRFFVAGIVLYAIARLRGEARPSLRDWRNVTLVSLSMFVVTYAALFWAEKSLASGIASILAATVPIATVVLEAFVFRLQRFQFRLLVAALVGFVGVGILMWQEPSHHIDVFACFAVLAGSTGWALGSVLSRRLILPASRVLTSGAEMLAGGAGLLTWSLLAGELAHPIPVSSRALWAWVYLVTAGSFLGFTAFVWLLRRLPASQVSSYAYVNPVVAVLLGHFIAGEQLSWRTLIGAALVIGSVIVTLRGKDKGEAPVQAERREELAASASRD